MSDLFDIEKLEGDELNKYLEELLGTTDTIKKSKIKLLQQNRNSYNKNKHKYDYSNYYYIKKYGMTKDEYLKSKQKLLL